MNQKGRQQEHLASSGKSKNLSTGTKVQFKVDKKKSNKIKGEKLDEDKAFKKLSKHLSKDIMKKPVKKKERFNDTHQTAYNSKRKDNDEVNRLAYSTIKPLLTDRQKQIDKRLLSKSRKLQIQLFDKATREKNLKRFSSAKNLNIQQRLPWGVDQIRIKKHVVQTIQKLNRIRNPSRSSSKSKKKRNRKQLGIEFLDKLSPEKVHEAVLKSQRSSRDLYSSLSNRSSKCHSYHLKTQQSQSRFPPHKLDIMQNFMFQPEDKLLPNLKSVKNVGSIKKVIHR